MSRTCRKWILNHFLTENGLKNTYELKTSENRRTMQVISLQVSTSNECFLTFSIIFKRLKTSVS